MDPVRVQVIYFSNWADGLTEAASYLTNLPSRTLGSRVSDPSDPELLRMARLDCDWDGECLRAFAAVSHPALSFEPALVANVRGLLQFIAEGRFSGAQPWLIFIDQRPAAVAPVIGRLLALFREKGGRVLYYSYDDASRNMSCHATEIAPHLSVLIHDEYPLTDEVREALPADCRTEHLSWVANIVPFTYPFDPEPRREIVFLGSKLGVTKHRLKQLRALESHFKDRFRSITDHSLPVAERGFFGGIQVHLCPEGRKFGTPSMSRSHTDRPFWAGCMGQVPVSENSARGDRLRDLTSRALVLGYDHADLQGMIQACERALELDRARRREIYEHFNRHETVGPVVAHQIAAFHGAGQTRTRVAELVESR